MKFIRQSLTLAAFLLALPALAEDKPATPRTGGPESDRLATGQSAPAVAVDAEVMLMQIDLKVLLQHYEKLRTELYDVEFQWALARTESLDIEDGATKEERERALSRKRREHEKLQLRRDVLEKMAAMQMIDVHLPTTDDRTVILTRYTQPEAEQRLLLEQSKLKLPEQSAPTISQPLPTANCQLPTDL